MGQAVKSGHGQSTKDFSGHFPSHYTTIPGISHQNMGRHLLLSRKRTELKILVYVTDRTISTGIPIFQVETTSSKIRTSLSPNLCRCATLSVSPVSPSARPPSLVETMATYTPAIGWWKCAAVLPSSTQVRRINADSSSLPRLPTNSGNGDAAGSVPMLATIDSTADGGIAAVLVFVEFVGVFVQVLIAK